MLIKCLCLGLSGSMVGLAITQTMALSGMVQWGMRQSAEVSNQLTAVERVMEYTELESEPNLEKNAAEKGTFVLPFAYPLLGYLQRIIHKRLPWWRKFT